MKEEEGEGERGERGERSIYLPIQVLDGIMSLLFFAVLHKEKPSWLPRVLELRHENWNREYDIC